MCVRKGFTLVELMVAILIVAILAVAAIPILRGRIDAAKWTEGRAMIGTIAQSIRAYVAEQNPDFRMFSGAYFADSDDVNYARLGLSASDFSGTFFGRGNFDWFIEYNPRTQDLGYEVRALATGTTIFSPFMVTLDHTGTWDEL